MMIKRHKIYVLDHRGDTLFERSAKTKSKNGNIHIGRVDQWLPSKRNFHLFTLRCLISEKRLGIAFLQVTFLDIINQNLIYLPLTNH